MKDLKKATILCIAIAGLMYTCSPNADEQTDVPEPPSPTVPEGKIPIRISTFMGQAGHKRVTDYAFESSDKVGLYVVNRNADGSANPLLSKGNHVDNMGFTYSGTWTPDAPVYWEDDHTHADFYLYYPYTATVGSVESMPFHVAADQSTEAAYKACDLLAGSTHDVAPTESAINITTYHLLSQMAITLVPGNGFTEENLAAADVSVRINGIKTGATVNLATAAVTATGEAETITPLPADGGYKALIVPQNVEQGNLITVTVDGREFNLSKAFTFEGGKRHRFTVTLSKTSNGINVSISPWEDDGTDQGGTAE